MPDAILGLSAFYHDSAAALLIDGKIAAAAHEERFTRRKHDASFPSNAVKYVLSEYGLRVSDLSIITFYDKPYLKFERLLETYHGFAPRGLSSFLSAIPVWIKEKLFMKQVLWAELEKINGAVFDSRPTLLFPEHHLSHAASAFYPSPFESAAILTIDGVGEWATTTICKGDGRDITILKEMDFPHSIGLLYSAFTYYCGFKVNSGEYKLMGLAPYGIVGSERVRRFKEIILSELIDLQDDGSLRLNLDYFAFPTGLRMCRDDLWEGIFGFPRRDPESELSRPLMDIALAIQEVTEEIVLRLARTARDVTNCDSLCMAGGVALNCVANGKVSRAGIFDRMWVQPAAGDAGGALGAAYTGFHIWQKGERRSGEGISDSMQGSFLGPEFDRADVTRLANRYQAVSRGFDAFGELCSEVAGFLAEGQVVGWFQGRMEYGPRALGNRSILGDPRDPDMQKKLNLKIKYREGFRPFAPSVLAGMSEEYFDMTGESPYMLQTAPVKEERRNPQPKDLEQSAMHERLYHQRSDLPAVTHVDYSSRIQTVHRGTNERFWNLIESFREKTGCGLLVNTSFNVRGEPMVCTPDDAYRCFMRTEMDWLVIGDFLFRKSDQPRWSGEKDWQEAYGLD